MRLSRINPDGTWRQCSVDNCDKPVKTRQLCNAHYSAFLKFGDPTVSHKRRATLCSVEDCGRPHEALGFCVMHYARYKSNGDPLVRRTSGPRPKGAANPKYLVGTDVNYWVAHRRVKAARGTASQFACVDCGNAAREWSYDKTDPEQLYGPPKPGSPYIAPYSLDVQRYHPRCVPCHRWQDRNGIGGY